MKTGGGKIFRLTNHLQVRWLKVAGYSWPVSCWLDRLGGTRGPNKALSGTATASPSA